MGEVELRRRGQGAWATNLLASAHTKDNFTDVTLVSGDNRQFQAHRLILASSSTFFEQLLGSHSHPHPLVFLGTTPGHLLASILTYAYLGEVRVAATHLDTFIQAAAELRMVGLEGEATREQVESKESVKIDFEKIEEESNPEYDINREITHVKEELSTVALVETDLTRCEKLDSPAQNEPFENLENLENPATLETEFADTPPQHSPVENPTKGKIWCPSPIAANIENIAAKPYVQRSQAPSQKEKNLACTICDYRIHRNDLLRVHMNSKHNVAKLSCDAPGCGKSYSSKSNLRNHRKSCHDCTSCGHVAGSNSDLRIHKKVEHNIQHLTY